MLRFKGIRKTTLADYPGEVACTLFTGGCNFRCPYCYNAILVFDQETGTNLSENEVLAFLKERQGLLDGVCVTGGEPLQNPQIIDFLKKVKALGFKVKIDTNGSYPEILKNVMDLGLADYIAMDIKGPIGKYEEIVGVPIDLNKIRESVELIKHSNLDYEFRTTVYTGLKPKDFEEIGLWLKGSKKYCLQQIQKNVPHLDNSFLDKFDSLSEEEFSKAVEILEPFFEKVEVRL
jgi:pyruvate formate lyase activating enzyme